MCVLFILLGCFVCLSVMRVRLFVVLLVWFFLCVRFFCEFGKFYVVVLVWSVVRFWCVFSLLGECGWLFCVVVCLLFCDSLSL